MNYTTSFTSHNLNKVKTILFLIFLLTTSLAADAQSLQWVNTLIGNNYNTSVNIVSDNAGDIYQTGRFISLVDFDPNAGIDTMNASAINGNLTSRAAYISRTNTSGNHVWARSFIPHNNTGESIAVSLDLDNSGNILSVGQFNGTVDFDPGPAIDTLSTYQIDEMSYIVKLDANGNYLWAKKIETIALPGSSSVYAVKTGASNSIYIYGIFTGTIDFDLGPGVNNVTAATVSNYLLKLDSNGDFMWIKTWDNSSNNSNAGGNRLMAIDPNDNIYLCLGFAATDTLDVDPGPLVNDMIGENFLVKMDSSGNFIWGGGCTAASMQVHLDKYGNLYTTGSFGLGADVDPGPGSYILNDAGDVYLTKSDPNGNLLWVKKFAGFSVQHITTDTAGNIFYAWSAGANAVDCDPDTSKYVIRGGNSKYIICGLDSSGAFKWAKKASWGNVCSNTGLRLSVTSANDLMITGRFCHVLDIDFSPAVYNIGQNSTLSCFLMKYNYCGNTSDFFYAGCDSVVLPDTTYHQTVDYVKEYLDVTNCDSNVNIHVNILSQQNEYTINSCDSVNYFGQTYTQTGTYTQIVPNAIGCDSVHTLHININTPTGQSPFLNLIQTFQPVSVPLIPQLHVLSYNIEIDSLYNMYISGGFVHHCDFNPLGVQYIDSSFYDLYGQFDGFVTRYDSSGILTWMHKIQTNDPWGSESTRSICLNDTLDLFSTTVVPAGISKCVVNKFNYSNTYFGATPIWGGGPWIENQVLNDPTSSSIVKIGYYDSISGFQSPKKFLAVWRGNDSVTFSVGGNFLGYQGAIDSQGNIYVASNMQPIDGGVTYCTIAKLDSNLNMLWNKQIAKGDEWGFTPLGTRINQLKVDTNGSLILCGRFSDTLDIDISPNTYNLISNGGFDAFIARFDTSANFIWAKSFGGAGDDVANTIITDMNGKIYVGGTFASASIDLDPSAGISFFMKNCVNTNWEGGYISKYKPDGTFMKAMGTGSNITELEFKAPKRIYSTGYPFVQVFELDYDTTVYNNVSICTGDSIMVGNSMYNQTGVYTDTFFTVLGSDSIVITTLTVNPLPAPILIFSGDTLFCTNITGVNIYWFKDTVAVDSLVNYYVVTQNGNYEVLVVDTNGCVGADSISMLNIGYLTQNKSDLIQVYPNPTHGDIYVSFYMNKTGEIDFIINDLIGNKVFASQKTIAGNGKQLVKLDFAKSNISSGVYFLNVTIEGRRHVMKLEYQR